MSSGGRAEGAEGAEAQDSYDVSSILNTKVPRQGFIKSGGPAHFIGCSFLHNLYNSGGFVKTGFTFKV